MIEKIYRQLIDSALIRPWLTLTVSQHQSNTMSSKQTTRSKFQSPPVQRHNVQPKKQPITICSGPNLKVTEGVNSHQPLAQVLPQYLYYTVLPFFLMFRSIFIYEQYKITHIFKVVLALCQCGKHRDSQPETLEHALKVGR